MSKSIIGLLYINIASEAANGSYIRPCWASLRFYLHMFKLQAEVTHSTDSVCWYRVMENIPRPILRWKREISPASFCQCYNWRQTRSGSPVLPPPHWEATRAGLSQTWRGYAPVSGLQEDASWRRTLPRSPSPWAPYALLHKWLLDHSPSGWQPCWDGWGPLRLPSPSP